MLKEGEGIRVEMAKPMASWVPVCVYAVLFGLGLSFELYVGNPTAIVYALVGIGMVLTYLTSAFYNAWVNEHNHATIQQVTLDVILKAAKDGTFPDFDGLSNDEKDTNDD